MRLVVDPAFFAPHPGSAGNDIEGHIAAALRCRELARNGVAVLGIMSQLLGQLAGLDLLPLRRTIEGLFERNGIRHISAHDFATLLLEIVELASQLDDEVIALEEAEPASLELDASLATYCECHAHQLDLRAQELWTFAAAWSARPAQAPYWDSMLTPRALRAETLTGTYAFEEVLYADGSSVADKHDVYALSLVAAVDDALSRVDPVVLARRAAEGGELPLLAVRSMSIQLLGIDVTVDTVNFGTEFVMDLRRDPVGTTDALLRRVLRACVEIFCDSAPAKSHGLRTKAGATSPQIVVDGYSAWRHDVDREFHIHYWRGPGGSIQLASVRVHNSFTIPPLSP